MRILFVCLGNICRSPTAEAALRAELEAAGLDGQVEVDSAGTGSWHVGRPPDRRMATAARRRGVTLEGRARQIGPDDFYRADLIVAMDRANLRALTELAPDEASRAKIRLFREFEEGADGDEVPDPYYGGDEGFERVLDIALAGARGILAHVRAVMAGSA